MKNNYIVAKKGTLNDLVSEVNRLMSEGYIPLGGPTTLDEGGFYQAMEKVENILAVAEEVKTNNGMGISFIGRFKDEPKGNTWYELPSDLNQYLNQSYCAIRGTTDHLTPDKDYRVTITFEEVKK